MSFAGILEAIFIGPLKLIFEYIFYFACKVVSHPGLAIIALSFAMNILVLPLYRRADAMQETSRDVEAKLSKGVNHIKKAFSGDERMMILQTYYRQNHYKPTDALKGSVSLLLEVPFFMAAYQFLSKAAFLEGISFGPIADLAAPDGLIVIGSLTLNALPILMTLVNVISSAIYLKGFPMKTKVQLYAMAAFFLVFLYNSPSGLVFYWTLNNLFSLVKTIFYKLKNPKRAAMILMFLGGLAIFTYGKFFYAEAILKRKLFVIAVGAAVAAVPVISFVLSKLPARKTPYKTNRKMFVLCGLFLTLLVGFLIPSSVVAASAQEFVDPANFHHPLWYVVHTACMAAGTFLVWMQVFYWLANDTGKAIFEKLVWILCGIMLVNYMFFGTDLGTLSNTLQYHTGLNFTASAKLVNLAVLACLSLVLFLLSWKFPKPVTAILLTASLAMGGMATVNMVASGRAVAEIPQNETASFSEDDSFFTLSKTGQNVVVVMLDRALGQFVPYIFNEKPELQQQFEGFTFYDNTFSFGGNTNFGAPALLGGYEYTTVEMNKRKDEKLVDKHNEALKVMPVLFSENGYKVTVCDPVYANYQWIPDLSIYDEYPEINAHLTEGAFTPVENAELIKQSTNRNFFCFSIMKAMPLAVQPAIYAYGNYNQLSAVSTQYATDMSTASGFPTAFLDSYLVLQNLPNMTGITAEQENTFLLLTNNTPHDPYILQAPEYIPAESVDNTEYDAAHADRFTNEYGTLNMETPYQMGHYHASMAAYIQMGNWFDWLRENDLYDNTRIILVADHGGRLYLQDEWVIGMLDLASYYPLLMVKDFNSNSEFTTDSQFMTNADVSVLATQDLIENPVNPFTGKVITNDEKYAHPQFTELFGDWHADVNNGNIFLPCQWACVEDNIWDMDNWTILTENIVLDEHEMP